MRLGRRLVKTCSEKELNKSNYLAQTVKASNKRPIREFLAIASLVEKFLAEKFAAEFSFKTTRKIVYR